MSSVYRGTLIALMPKAQHQRSYQPLPTFLRRLREDAGLTQRDIGERLDKPQSYIHNCETGNRRVDVTEFVAWCEACDVEPKQGFAQFLRASR